MRDGVLPADLKRTPYKAVEVMGKTADQVADEIFNDLGTAKDTGPCVCFLSLSLSSALH